jgi:hypothetical protein
VIDSDPATPEKLAEITTLPLVRLVTSPVDETVAMLVSDDVHAALGVTSATAPLLSVSVAVNCVDDPTAGAVPVTVIDDTMDGAVVDELPHAAADMPTARAQSSTTNDLILMMTPCRGDGAGRRHYKE